MQISCGCRHTALVTLDHHLFIFAEDKYGKLGLPYNEDLYVPPILIPDIDNGIQVSCGAEHTAIIRFNK